MNTLIKLRILTLFAFLFLIACSSDDPNNNNQETDNSEVEIQNVVINSDDYKQEFSGGGVSIGLFLGHHYSMSVDAQDKALQYIAKDLNMQYFQDYIEIYPSDDPEYFDRRANYIKAGKIYQPDLKFSLVGNKFPADLMTELRVGSENLKVLNTDDPEIYHKLANWWFLLFKGFQERGVSTEILNVVNEPDLDRTFRKYHYGMNGNTKEAVSQIFKQAVPKFLALFDDPSANTMSMQKPLIMGPSTISPIGCIDYIRYFKNRHPEVWDLIDIVATHQYENGGKPDLFQQIESQAEGKPIYQSETHALKGDGLDVQIVMSRSLEATLSLANLFSTAVNNGVNSWWYFENNYPNVEVHPGGLLSIPWAADGPTPYKHYYAFKQLTSSQPAFSNVITVSTSSDEKSDVIALRKKGENELYLHYSNYTNKDKRLEVSLKGNKKIVSYTVVTTNYEMDEKETDADTFESGVASASIPIVGLSVNTIKIEFKM